ncbi:hypothetical protein [Photobacterium galatheae]|uniref:Uncharacterized protein n=1 Tax=Photobacterium galatheae TaxID=1654360 RepID=A0A066RS31_9GAMM|nr:hypothetical protein [Photobacterium galatheae]KDM90512.1 hypothetical protein EA58_16430 [Photobacterium galatheae]MCM0148032.1 hypothetical protein [Photobacterium galatheae]
MPTSDKKHVNFSEEHELNNRLRQNDKRQTEANREQLKEIGKQAKEDLGKTRLTHAELDNAIKKNQKDFE